VVSDGTMVYRQSNASASGWDIYMAGSKWMDQTVEAKLKAMSFRDQTALVALFGRNQNVVNGGDCAYLAGLRGDGAFVLGKRVNGATSVLASTNQGVVSGTWYALKLNMTGTTVTAYLNGTQLLSQDDSDCQGGSVGVGSLNASFEADDVRVTATATNTCIQGWRTTTCDMCTGQTQEDRKQCWRFLDCYANHGCGPETCGGDDDFCGVHQAGNPANPDDPTWPKLNAWGMAPKSIADQVYKCKGCAGSVRCDLPAKPDWAGCADGDACTTYDSCQQGVCVGQSPVTCQAADQCHDVGTCAPLTGVCSNPTKAVGSACDDGLFCTENDQCTVDGTCTGSPRQCSTPPDAQCYDAAGTCTGDTCTYAKKADFTACDDGNPDTVADSCQDGACRGVFAAKHIHPADQADTVQSQLPGSFSVSADGAATYTIPLDIPEGRAGISPKLALTYNSNGGNGLVGVGWSLSGASSMITRCPRTHAVDGYRYPITYDAAKDPKGLYVYDDRFCLDGDYLVLADNPTVDPKWIAEYRPEHNPSVRVTTWRTGDSDGPMSFLVEDPDGKKSIYDTIWTAPGYWVQADHKSFSPTTAIFSGQRKYAWLLRSVSDLAGNTMTITYDSADQGVPTSIAYTSLVSNGVTTVPALRKVEFGYETRGPIAPIMADNWESWVGGTPTYLTSRLKTIKVSGPNPTAPSALWTYTLDYKNDSVSGRSLLHSVKQCDASGLCKPETTFDWEKGASTFSPTQYLSLGSAVKIADVNGDGLPDLISAMPQLAVLLASKSGGQLSYHQMATTGISSDLVGTDVLADVTPIDIDGDGAAELAVRQNESGKQWLRFYRFNGTKFDQMADDGNEVPNNIDPYIYVGDLDGDGLPELIRAVSGNWSYRKNNAGVLGPYVLLGPPKDGGGTTPVAAINGYNNFIGDLDGSGRSTILLMTGAGATETRYGGFNLTTTTRSANGVNFYASTIPWVARGIDTGRGKVILDLNGDGMADAVEYPTRAFVDQTFSSTSFVNTGRGMVGGTKNFAEPVTEEEQIYSDDKGHDILIVMDVNQDGRDDIISAPVTATEGSPLRVFLSTGKGLSEPATISYSEAAGGGTINWGTSTTGGRFHSFDANGDGLADFMMAQSDGSIVSIYLHDGKKADMITSFNNGSGSSVEVTYSSWQRSEPYSKPADCKYPVRCPARGIWVVSDYRLNLHDGAETYPEYTYTYDLPAIDMLGRGWLGFGKRSVTLVPTGQVTSFVTFNTFRRGTSYPYAWHPDTVQNDVLLENGTLLTGVTHNWYDLLPGGNVDVPGHSFAYGLYMSQYDESEKADSGKGTVTTFRQSTTNVNYDSYGNVYETKRRHPDGFSDASVVTHLNDAENWILSAPTQVLSASAPNGNMVVRTTTYDYSPTLPRSLKKVTVEPDGDASTHLEISITEWNKFALPQKVDAVDRAGTHRTGSVEYDDLEGSQSVATTNSVGQTSHTVYHKGLNLPIWTSDINGLGTDIYYYPFGRLQSVVPPDNNILTMSYTSPPADVGGVLQVTSSLASGQVKSKVLDLLDRPISATSLAMNGKTARTDRWYNRVFVGKIGGVTIPYFTDDTTDHPYNSFSYDLSGRLKGAYTADGRAVTVEYSGLKTTTTDPKGNKSYSIEDQAGRMTKHVSIMPASDVGGAREIPTQYVWGPFSLLEQVIDANGNTVKTPHDTLGRVSTTTDPDRGNRTLTFDAFGDLVTVVDPKGTTTFTPDGLGRTTKVVSPDGTASYAWDTATNGKGALASSTSADGIKKTMTYDKLSRLESETWTIDGESYVIGMTYDASLGRLDTVSFPEVPGFSQFKTKYGYAANGEVLSLKDVPSGTTAARQFWKADDRDPAGRMKQEEFGDGSQTSYGIDQVRGVLTGITTTLGTSTLQSLVYDYDQNLNVKTRSDAIVGLSEQFDYDALDRLHTWQEVGSSGWGVTYSHDDIGNLTGRSLLGGKGETESLTFEHSGVNAGPHGVTKSAWGTYGYDGKGNQTSSPEGTITYTAFNLPKKIVGADTTTYKYDASGARVLKQSTVIAGTTIYAGGSYELRTVGTEKTHVFYLSALGRQIGQVLRKESDHSETVLYIHTDALGSSEIVTDASGKPVGQRRKYDPFGAPTDISLPKGFPGGVLISSDVHRGFTGHEEDSETGLINMRGRIYNPRVGQFLTPDPFVSDAFSPVGFNPYAYVLNNPLRYTDPSGLDAVVVFPGGIEAIQYDNEEVHSDLPSGAGASGSAFNPYDSVNWTPGGNNLFPVERVPGPMGKLVMRLPGGGWLTQDEASSPNPLVHFVWAGTNQEHSMPLGAYEDKYFYNGDGVTGAHNQQVRDNRGLIDDNPSIYRIGNISPSAPSPMAVGGQSAASPGINRGGNRTTSPNGFYSDVNPTNGAEAELFEGVVKIAVPTSPEGLAVSVLLPVVGKYLVEGKAARVVIGKLGDLTKAGALRQGEQTLLSKLPNLGSPKANWLQNSSKLREAMRAGNPIRDVAVNESGALINNTGFLRAERNLLESQGWTYDAASTLWSPPVP
jgi:RHS repeat-associated protein